MGWFSFVMVVRCVFRGISMGVGFFEEFVCGVVSVVVFKSVGE